ncbi:MAG TPA: ABC transporter permease [Pyrinomonadaceae bacterium]
MSALPQDLKFGFRMLLRKPLLTIGISLSLALGIGANSAVFSLVDAILFRPLNVASSSRLASLYTSDYSGRQYGGSSYADFVDFKARTDVFENMAAFTEFSAALRSDTQADRAFGIIVSENYFDLLGVQAGQGRTFGGEDQSGPVLVVSHDLWQRRFGGDPALVGKTVFLNNNNFTVIGITPANFTGIDLGRSPELFVPMHAFKEIGFEPGFTANRGTRQFSIVGRVKPDVTETQAQASLNLLAQQLATAYPEDWKERNQQTRRISVVAERYARVPPEVKSVLMGLAGLFAVLVGLVLLIACSNISNMLLARATARQKEMAVRSALGASRGRIIRQLLTESFQLSLIGSVLGILLAPVCIKLLTTAFLPSSSKSIPIDFSLNQRVILLTLAVGLIAGLIFGLVPALHASRSDLSLAMKDDAVLQTGRRRFGIRNLFVMSQISASLLLLIVAGLFIRSLQKAQHVDVGYDINHVLTIRPEPEFFDKPDIASRLAVYNQVLERVRVLPGVEGASFADFVPSGGGLRRTTIRIENYTPRADESMDVMNGVVATDYFKTMGMTLVAGREFTDLDKDGGQRTAIVNETLAQRYWPGQTALGKHITIGGSERGSLEVVGVVKDATAYIYQKGSSPFFYVPLQQNAGPGGMVLHVRTKGDPTAILPPVRSAIISLDPNAKLGEIKPLSEFMNDSLIMLRIVSALTGVFGLLALVLAVVGVFSVINYSTSRRTREIGIRLALGAQRADILKMIMKEALFIVVAGVVVGMLLAISSAQLIASFLFANSGTETSIYVAVAVFLIAIAMLACFIPAYKATKVDPNEALRHE